MKAVQVYSPGEATYVDVQDYRHEGWVKIRVISAGLCGSDVQRINNPQLNRDNYILGHEFSGYIEDLGNTVMDFSEGDFVTAKPLVSCDSCYSCYEGLDQFCDRLVSIGKDLPGAFAEYLYAPSKNMRKVPQKISPETAAMSDVAAAALHAYNISGKPTGKKVLIIGDGPIGLSCVQILRNAGNSVSLVGKNKNNTELAKYFGADVIQDPQKNLYDVVFEAVGRMQENTISKTVNSVKPRGKIVVLGVFPPEYFGKFEFRSLFYKEATLLGSNSYGFYNGIDEFDKALKMIEVGDIDYSRIVTHVLPLEKFNEGLELLKNRNFTGAIKIVYRP